MDETIIIKQIQKGHVDEYRQLVERYHIGLIIHCERLLGNRDDAEDIAQEAFIRAFNHLTHFQPDRARFSTWLYKIATNAAIDFLRTHRREATVENIDALAEATMPTVLQDETKREVRQAVKLLTPPQHRRVVEAYYWEGKSYQQIADDLDVPINTIRTWLRRAKAQLKEQLS